MNVRCNGAATILMSDSGVLYACGENNDNRLGLSEDSWTSWFTFSYEDEHEKVLVPTRIKTIKERIVDVAMAPFHTVCLTEHGKVLTMGRNSEAQLGRGHTDCTSGTSRPKQVKAMKDKEVTLISAGSTFTVVGTSENVLYFWGTRHYNTMSTRPNTRDIFNHSFGTRIATPLDKPISESEVHSMLQLESMRRNLGSGDFHSIPDSSLTGSILTASGNNRFVDQTIATLSATDIFRHRAGIAMRDVVLEPVEILALYASVKSVQRGETIMLRDIKCQNQNIFVVVETTCPVRKETAPNSPQDIDNKTIRTVHDLGVDDQTRDSLEATEPVPDWVRQEIESSDMTWHHKRPSSVPNPAKKPRVKNRELASGTKSAPQQVDQRQWDEQLKV